MSSLAPWLAGPFKVRAEAPYRPGDCLRHPLVLLMLALWLLNDHVFKAMFGNAFTGKLSDIAGLVVFPLIFVGAYEIVCGLRRIQPKHARTILWAGLGLSAALMIGINLFDVCAQACRIGLGLMQWPFRSLWALSIMPVNQVSLTMDPSDLWTLPALLIPYVLNDFRLNAALKAQEKELN